MEFFSLEEFKALWAGRWIRTVQDSNPSYIQYHLFYFNKESSYFHYLLINPSIFWMNKATTFLFLPAICATPGSKATFYVKLIKLFWRKMLLPKNYCFAGKLLLRRLVSRGHFLQLIVRNLIVNSTLSVVLFAVLQSGT